jgi:hypothetical protein
MKFDSISSSTSIALRLSSMFIMLFMSYTMLSAYFPVDFVNIPKGCADACPPQRDPSRFICARHSQTGALGMFRGECFFGRYNHCTQVKERKRFQDLLVSNFQINLHNFIVHFSSLSLHSIWQLSRGGF